MLNRITSLINSQLNRKKTTFYSSIPHQIKRLRERKKSSSYFKKFMGKELIIYPGVYRTGMDTELMCKVVKPDLNDTILEIGCGSGAICVYLSDKCKSGLAVDINKLAIQNTIENFRINNVKNIGTHESDVFSKVDGKFDVIICNPPYNNHIASDNVEKMFWDTNDSMKTTFFNQVENFMETGGRLYFGWADFSDLNRELPLRVLKKIGFNFVKVHSKKSTTGEYSFLVYEFEFIGNNSEHKNNQKNPILELEAV